MGSRKDRGNSNKSNDNLQDCGGKTTNLQDLEDSVKATNYCDKGNGTQDQINKMDKAESSQEVQNQDDDQVLTILPSYYMYSNTINAGINEALLDPPIYERHNSMQSTISSESSRMISRNPSVSITNDAQITPTTSEQVSVDDLYEHNHIKDNLVDNIHRLKDLTDSKNEMAKALKMSVVFTKEPGKYNVKQEVVDPKDFEYCQGDFIHGHVLIENTSSMSIPFDTFYTVLEGQFRIKAAQGAAGGTVHTFLQMFDFYASYNEADIDNNRYINKACPPTKIVVGNMPMTYDPLDGTIGCFHPSRLMLPHSKYKRFFSFRIPEKLLDSVCNHDLGSHVQVPPSMGGATTPDGREVKDFGFVNTSVKYTVWARFVGRHSRYTPLPVEDPSEYVVLKAIGREFRILPAINSDIESVLRCKTYFEYLMKFMDDKIAEGLQLGKGHVKLNIEAPVLFQQMGDSMREQKRILQPLESQRGCKTGNRDMYDFVFPLYKSSLLGTHHLNTLNIKFPKLPYTIDYIPQCGIGRSAVDPRKAASWKIDVPMELSILADGGNKEVHVKSISAEFVAVTIVSPGYHIPIELHHDMLFNRLQKATKEDPNDIDDLIHNIVKPVRDKSNKLFSVTQRLGSAGLEFPLEKQLVHDVKALASLRSKHINLEIPKINVLGNSNWVTTGTSMTRNLNIHLDLSTAHLKGILKGTDGKAYDKYSLVPNFQTCHMTRMYHIRFTLCLSNGQNVKVKAPIRIVHCK